MGEQRPRLRRLGARALLAACATVVALLLAEVAVRALGVEVPPRGPSNKLGISTKVTQRQVRGLGYRLVPGRSHAVTYDGTGEEEDRVVHYEVNSLGFRDREDRTAAKPAGTMRVLSFGDSFTFGTGVALEDTWPLQLERELDGPVEVWNCGVFAYDARQEAALLRWCAPGLDPDVVLFCLYINDASGEGPAADPPWEVRWTQRLGLTSGIWDEDDPMDDAKRRTMALRRRSRLVDLLAHKTHRFISARVAERNYHADWLPGSPGLEKVRAALVDAATVARELDFELLVLMYPDLSGLDGEYPFAAEHARVAELCAGLGIPFHDLTPAVAGRDPGSLHVHAHDRHPNPPCNALVARHLAQVLRPVLSP